MDKKTKTYLIVAGIVLLIIIAVGIWFYRKGKKQVTILPPPLDNPNSTGDTKNNPYSVASASITELSERLYDDMKGFNVWRDNEPYKKLIGLSDTDFVKVYNAFNTAHQSEGNGTLKGWLQDESGIGEFSTLKDEILTRMGRLNLI